MPKAQAQPDDTTRTIGATIGSAVSNMTTGVAITPFLYPKDKGYRFNPRLFKNSKTRWKHLKKIYGPDALKKGVILAGVSAVGRGLSEAVQAGYERAHTKAAALAVGLPSTLDPDALTRLAAGGISTLPPFADQHPEEALPHARQALVSAGILEAVKTAGLARSFRLEESVRRKMIQGKPVSSALLDTAEKAISKSFKRTLSVQKRQLARKDAGLPFLAPTPRSRYVLDEEFSRQNALDDRMRALDGRVRRGFGVDVDAHVDQAKRYYGAGAWSESGRRRGVFPKTAEASMDDVPPGGMLLRRRDGTTQVIGDDGFYPDNDRAAVDEGVITPKMFKSRAHYRRYRAEHPSEKYAESSIGLMLYTRHPSEQPHEGKRKPVKGPARMFGSRFNIHEVRRKQKMDHQDEWMRQHGEYVDLGARPGLAAVLQDVFGLREGQVVSRGDLTRRLKNADGLRGEAVTRRRYAKIKGQPEAGADSLHDTASLIKDLGMILENPDVRYVELARR